MKKGFYDEIILDKKGLVKNNYDLYEFMMFTPIGDKCVDLYKYLSELDDEFSICLAKKFGYNINILVKYDYELGRDVLVHAYNSTIINGKEIFVDARGITSDIDDILEFADNKEIKYHRIFRFGNINAAKEKLRSLTGVKYDYKNSEISYILNNLKHNYII